MRAGLGILCGVFGIACAAAAPARAVVIYDDFTPPGSNVYVWQGGYYVQASDGFGALAAGFVTPAGPPLAVSEIDLSMTEFPGFGASFQLSVEGDAGGLPDGTPLASTLADAPLHPVGVGSPAAALDVSIASPPLAPSTTYWVVAEPLAGTWDSWNQDPSQTLGGAGLLGASETSAGGSWSALDPTSETFYLRVIGAAPAPAPAPEPGSLVLAALGTLGALAARRRRARAIA
jgi:hypothetical protein